jgi:hypothetical protein
MLDNRFDREWRRGHTKRPDNVHLIAEAAIAVVLGV